MVCLNSCDDICNTYCQDFRSHVMFLVLAWVFSSCDWDKNLYHQCHFKRKDLFYLILQRGRSMAPWSHGLGSRRMVSSWQAERGRGGKEGDSEGGWVGGRGCECEYGQTKDKIPPRTCPWVSNFSSETNFLNQNISTSLDLQAWQMILQRIFQYIPSRTLLLWFC